jgi:hypothetical protein
MAQPLADLAAEMRADVFRRDAAMSRRDLFQSGILKDRHECSASAVRERIRTTLAIMRDEPPDGHRLHRMRKNTDRGMVDAGRGAEQDHSSCALRFVVGFAMARASSDLWDFCNAQQMFSPSHIVGRISRSDVTSVQQYSGGEE